MFRSIAPSVAAIAAVLMLSGCIGASPDSSPPAVFTARPTGPTSTPSTAVEAAVAGLRVRADALEFLAADGGQVGEARAAYRDPVDAVLARLTDLLGPSVDETYNSAHTSGSGTLHRWDGLVIDDFPDELVAGVPEPPRWGVRLEADSTDGLSLETVDGLGVGDSSPTGLATSACGAPMAEIVGGLGVELDLDPTESLVEAVRSPVYTDACD